MESLSGWLCRDRRAGWWAACAVFSLAWAGVVAKIADELRRAAPGALFDSDCYLRLIKARALWERGEHPFGGFWQSDFPRGETTAWTLPADILLGLAALPLKVAGMPWREALEAAGYWFSPALFLVAGWMFLRALREAGGTRAALAGAILLPLSQAVINMFFPARPDHHGLLQLCWCAGVSGTAIWLHRADRMGWLHAGAVAAAVMFWISVEGGYLSAALMGLLGLNVILRGDAAEREAAFAGLKRFVLVLTVLCFAFAGIEGAGQGCMAWVWDRLSWRHASGLCAALAVLVAARGAWVSRSRVVRLAAAAGTAGAGLAAFGATAALEPAWLRAEGVRAMLEFLMRSTSDNQPVYAMWEGWLPSLLLWFGAPLVIWPVALWRWLRDGPLNPAARWFAAGVGVAYVPMGLQISRWNLYGSTCLAFFAAWWLGRIADDWERRRRGLAGSAGAREALWLLLILSVATGLAGRMGYACTSAASAEASDRAAIDTAILRMREAWRSDALRRGVESRQVLAPTAWGPALMYQWDACVLGTPYYRNARGMERSFAWLCSRDPEAALSEIRREHWAYALVSKDRPPPEIGYYLLWLKDRGPPPGRGPGSGGGNAMEQSPMLVEILCGRSERLPPGVVVVAEQPVGDAAREGLRLLYLGGAP